jgi:tetratricopeptide (TPR) repeat protein
MSTDRLSSGQIEKLVLLVLALVTLVAFWQVRYCQFVTYDDHLYVYDNPHVRQGLTREGVRWAFTTSHASNWHPLTWLSLQLDAQIYPLGDKIAPRDLKTQAAGFHLTNVLLHTANVLLLFWVLRRMSGAIWPSAVVAGFFALHPLHVESVAWVSERKDVLSTLFWMLALWAYVRHVERPGLFRYLLVFGALALGLMAKPMLVTFPCVLLLLDYWPLRRALTVKQAKADATGESQPGKSWKFLVVEKLPPFALVAASCVITCYVQSLGHAVRALDDLGFAARLSNAVIAYADYLQQTVWPRHLAVFYPHTDLTWDPWRVLRASMLIAAITLLVIWQRRRRPYLLVGWLWYLGTLVPVIGLVQVGEQARADRYTYVPLIGVFVMIAWSSAELARPGLRQARAVAVATGAVLVACAVLTWLQVPYWKDSVALWQHTVDATGPNAAARYGLGIAYYEVNQFDQAADELRESLRIRPWDERAHFQLGNILSRQGKLPEAIFHYQDALQLRPSNAVAHMNLAIDLIHLGKQPEARAHLDEAGRLDPQLRSTPNYQSALTALRSNR